MHPLARTLPYADRSVNGGMEVPPANRAHERESLLQRAPTEPFQSGIESTNILHHLMHIEALNFIPPWSWCYSYINLYL